MATIRELKDYRLMRQHGDAKRPMLAAVRGYLLPKEGARSPIETVGQTLLWERVLGNVETKAGNGARAPPSEQKLKHALLMSARQKSVKERLAAEDERLRRERAKRIASGGRLASIGDLQECKAHMRNPNGAAPAAAKAALRAELKSFKLRCGREEAAKSRLRLDTALVLAVDDGDLAKVRRLLREGASPYAKDVDGNPVELIAKSDGEHQIARLIGSFTDEIGRFIARLDAQSA